MARYINLDELLNAIDKQNGRLPLWLDDILMEDCKIADVEPVKHGHWIECNYGLTFECSECKYPTEYSLTDYCPNCGAKMDGDPYG